MMGRAMSTFRTLKVLLLLRKLFNQVLTYLVSYNQGEALYSNPILR